MAKGAPDPLQASGERLLESWGLSAAATPAELAAVLGRDPAADVAIARRLGGLPSEETVTILQRLEREAGDKRVRKEAKRALYRLEQRGVAIPPPAEPRPAVTAGPAIEGYISPVDGRGDQLIWLVRPQPGGLAHLFAITNDPAGLRETALTMISRKALKSMREELERKHELKLVAVDWRYADYLIHRAFTWARERGTPMVGDYPALRAQLVSQPPTTEPPPLPGALAAGGDDEAALASSAELLTQPELRTWFIIPEQLQPELEALAEARESPLVLSEMQQRERQETIVTDAIRRLYGGEQQPSVARRLFGLAVYFAADGRDTAAAQARAAARALEAGTPPEQVPICAVLVRTSFAVIAELAAEAEKERAKSSLVLTPQQAAARRERR